MTEPLKKRASAAIANMAEPLDDDCASALIVLVYRAREALSLAERQADQKEAPLVSVGLLELETAHRHLNGAFAISQELPHTRRARTLIDRAIRATEGALAQVRLYELYSKTKDPTPLETKQLGHIKNIWRRGAEAARKEAHRALEELAQRFPDAYDTDTEDI